MLKRANIALASSALPGFLAYTGLVDAITPTAKVIAFVLLGFSVVSFLLSLFEDEEGPLIVQRKAAKPVVFRLDEAQVVRVAP